MDIFNNLGNAKIAADRPGKFEIGDHFCTIKEVLLKETRDRKTLFIVEFEDQNGDIKSWIQDMGKVDVADSNVKRFLYAASGFSTANAAEIEHADSKIGSRLKEIAIAATQKGLLNGQKIRVNVASRVSKAGKDYMYYTFKPAD